MTQGHRFVPSSLTLREQCCGEFSCLPPSLRTPVSMIGMVVLIGKWNLSELLLISQIVEPWRFRQLFQAYSCGTDQGQKKDNQTLCTHAAEVERAPGQKAGIPGARLPYLAPVAPQACVLIYSILHSAHLCVIFSVLKTKTPPSTEINIVAHPGKGVYIDPVAPVTCGVHALFYHEDDCLSCSSF